DCGTSAAAAGGRAMATNPAPSWCGDWQRPSGGSAAQGLSDMLYGTVRGVSEPPRHFKSSRSGATLPAAGGRSSVVERQLPKLNVVGSIPIARSNLFRDQALSC